MLRRLTEAELPESKAPFVHNVLRRRAEGAARVLFKPGMSEGQTSGTTEQELRARIHNAPKARLAVLKQGDTTQTAVTETSEHASSTERDSQAHAACLDAQLKSQAAQ